MDLPSVLNSPLSVISFAETPVAFEISSRSATPRCRFICLTVLLDPLSGPGRQAAWCARLYRGHVSTLIMSEVDRLVLSHEIARRVAGGQQPFPTVKRPQDDVISFDPDDIRGELHGAGFGGAPGSIDRSCVAGIGCP
jgi:hypothetical protein